MSKDTKPPTARPAGPPRRFNARALIVEDQRLIADFLTLHCRSLGLTVVATCRSLAEGLATCRAEKPDLVLMDFSLGDGNGLEAAQTLMKEQPTLRVLGISSHCDAWTMLQVQRIGLHGFVDKHNPSPEELTRAIEAVLDGRIHYSQLLTDTTAALRRDSNAFFRILSDYEIQILALIGESKTDEEIGAILGISPLTMQSRRRDILKKLDIHSTPKLIHFAIAHGLTRPEKLIRLPS